MMKTVHKIHVQAAGLVLAAGIVDNGTCHRSSEIEVHTRARLTCENAANPHIAGLDSSRYCMTRNLDRKLEDCGFGLGTGLVALCLRYEREVVRKRLGTVKEF